MLNGAAKSIERHGQMELSRQLKTRREEQGLSQDEVAKAIFVSRQTISNWETDKTYPDVQSLLLLSQLYDTSIDELVRGDAGRIQQVVERDSRKMRLLSYGMIGFSLLAFLFLLGFSLAWRNLQLCPHEQAISQRRVPFIVLLRHPGSARMPSTA